MLHMKWHTCDCAVINNRKSNIPKPIRYCLVINNESEIKIE